MPKESAIAFGLLYHALQVVPLVAVGLILDGKTLFRGWGPSSNANGGAS